MKVLIASDGSQYAHDAARFGRLLADALGATVQLLGVAESTDMIVALRDHLSYLEQELDPEHRLPYSVRHGRPVDEILDEAVVIGAHVLVIGIRGRRNVAELIVGDTARQLARKTTVPLAIVRQPRPSIKKILVSTAGCEESFTNTQLGARIAQGSGASLTFLHVMSQVSVSRDVGQEALLADAEWHRQHETPEGRHLDALLRRAHDFDIEAEARIRHGLVVDEIEAEAEEGDYDLVIIGAHRQRGIWRWLLADVTEQVLRRVDRPILIVP